MRITLTYDTAMMAGQDAANANMRANGRKAWNEEDADFAVETVDRLAYSLYRAEHPDEMFPTPLDICHFELQQVRGILTF